MQAKVNLLPLLLSAVILTAVAQQCPDLYKRYSSQHTFCLPPNKSCSIVKRGVSDKDKQNIVNIHNEYRNKVATGQENLAGHLPTAANMLEMIWDDELAKVAQKLAETCKYGHDCYNCRRVQAFGVGQNIGRAYGLQTAPSSADWKGFIKGLYDEVQFFDKNKIKPFVPSPSGDGTYGHFTQVAWATSWRVGCGWAAYKEGNSISSYTVCNYGPGGNLGTNGEMYKVGPTCSACPKNTCCGSSCSKQNVKSNYNGLCKVIDEQQPPEGAGPQKGNYLLYCDFNKQSDCALTTTGKAWNTVKTPGGNYISVVLNGGEKTKLTFNKKVQAENMACLVVVARSAPNVDGQASAGEGYSTLDTGSPSYRPTFSLDSSFLSKELRQKFIPNTYKVGLLPGQKTTLQFIFEFSVSQGSPPQFVEIKEASIEQC